MREKMNERKMISFVAKVPPRLSELFGFFEFLGAEMVYSFFLQHRNLDPLQQLHILLVLVTPGLEAVLQVGTHEGGVEEDHHLPHPAAPLFGCSPK